MKPWVVMRSRNDAWVIESTLQALREQNLPHHLLVLDNASSDGTRELAARYADELIDVPEGSYVPGKVLNQGMRTSQSELVVFLNSDCTPQHPEYLQEMLRPFEASQVGAVFGRQLPRPDCFPIFARETWMAYPPEGQPGWRAAFSMASSAVRRSAWEQVLFREDLSYSEDIDWSQRLQRAGFEVAYAPRAQVMHSHNYTPEQLFRRMYGEGKAEASIFEWSPWQRSWLRYSLLPLLRILLRDWRFCLNQGRFDWIWPALNYRWQGARGRRKGFLEGLR